METMRAKEVHLEDNFGSAELCDNQGDEDSDDQNCGDSDVIND